jgi:lincosamide nucleotidyltransferase A/C/D/E
LEGGWGVDALVGRQTRPHRDVDIDAAYQAPVLLALYERGYRIETDWRPNRVEPYFTLGRLGGRRVPCFTVEAQCLFHTGYELRDVDRHDLGLLDALRPC